jgi:hypothetical protein
MLKLLGLLRTPFATQGRSYTQTELTGYQRIRTPRLPINPFRSLSSTSLL